MALRSGPASRNRRWWLLVVLVIAAGLASSAWLGVRRAAAVEGYAHDDFDARSEEISASIGTELRRIGDLVSIASTYLDARPDLSNAEFDDWSRRTARERHTGFRGFGYIARVPAPELAGFLSVLEADPPRALPSPYTIVPEGDRPVHCLARYVDAGARALFAELPPTLDVCAIDGFGGLLAAVGDSGDPGLTSLAMPGDPSDSERVAEARKILGRSFAVIAPVYRGEPRDAIERRTSLDGWVVGVFDGPRLVQGALPSGSRPAELTLTWTGGGERVQVATAGAVTSEAWEHTEIFRADGRWTLRLREPVRAARAVARTEGWSVFGIGSAMTLLIAALLVSLVSARNRALRMVDLKTDELRHQALHDALTGLPNRVLALDRCEQALARSRRERTAAAALFIDLDNFKSINDTFGHAAGDELLQAVAHRLRTTVRESETVARLGGDEFVIITDGCALGSGAELLAQRILDVMAEPFLLPHVSTSPLMVSMSVGVATGDRADASDLLRDADVALYRAKEDGKSRYVLFEPEMQAMVHDRLAMELDLHRALEEDQLHLVYQPTFSLEDSAVIGVEALLRWQHPTRGLIPPLDFIPLAEDTGLIVPIGAWVLSQTCAQGAAWHAAGFPVSVAVNVSARQLDSDEIVETVARALRTSALPPSSLIIEITESTLMEDATATATRLHALKALGVRIAIDDFGTGYSSLSYLQQFPVDTLKIDRSFVAAIGESPESRAMVHTLVQLGKSLGLETLAEGIERPTQLDELRSESCDSGQGFLFARPLDVASASVFFAEHGVRVTQPA